MSDAAQIVENLINTDDIHAFVFVCEAADKYLPMFESISVALKNGKVVGINDIDRGVAQKVDETRKTLKREDRVIWALRFFKKAIIEELLWLVQNEPGFFQKRFRAKPLPEQKNLERQLQKLADVDIAPFQEYDPSTAVEVEPPYASFGVIDAINERIGHFISVAAEHGATDPENAIHTLQFSRQSFGEIISILRRGEIEMRKRHFPGGIQMYPTPEGPYDLRDDEGPVETIIEFPNGWRWFDLHRSCSKMRDDRDAPSDIAVTGHCANVASKKGLTAFELAEPLGNDKWKHHAFFVMHDNGQLGEMKGRKNQKPSPRLEKYIFELLRHEKRIKGVSGPSFWNSSHNFTMNDLTKSHLDTLMNERPDIFKSVDPQEQI